MSKIVVDELPNHCGDCPLFAYVYPSPHPSHDRFHTCPLKEEYPLCLDRFVELADVQKVGEANDSKT